MEVLEGLLKELKKYRLIKIARDMKNYRIIFFYQSYSDLSKGLSLEIYKDDRLVFGYYLSKIEDLKEFEKTRGQFSEDVMSVIKELIDIIKSGKTDLESSLRQYP